MDREDDTISRLYESIHKVDYFSVDEKDFDEDKFFSVDEGFMDLRVLDVYGYILESFKQVKHNSPTDDGQEDVYEVVLHNGQLFTLHLNYIDAKESKAFFHKQSLIADKKNQNTLAEKYRELKNGLKEDETICVVMFKDEQGKFEQTGKVGMSAKELFITLKNAILDSWTKRDHKQIKALVMRVAKNEPKRLEFYKLLLKKFLVDYDNIIVDNVAEYSNTLLIATK